MTGKDMAKPIFGKKWRWSVDENASIRPKENARDIAFTLIMMYFGQEI
jgi:hypothetical protein